MLILYVTVRFIGKIISIPNEECLSKRPLDAPLNALSKLYDVLVGYVASF